MKRLAIILALLIPQISWSQFPLNSEGFKASKLVVHTEYQSDGSYTKYHKEFDHDVLFYFQDGFVFTEGLKNGQLSGLGGFKFEEGPDWWDDAINDMNGDQPGYTGYALDRDLNRSLFSVIYHESAEKYLLIMEYSNDKYCFICEPTSKRPLRFQDHPLTPTNLIEDGKKYRTNPDYTEEELIEFFDNFGNGKVILEGIKASFYAGEIEF